MDGIPLNDIVLVGILYPISNEKALAFKGFLDRFNILQNKKNVLVLLRAWVFNYYWVSVAPENQVQSAKKIYKSTSARKQEIGIL